MTRICKNGTFTGREYDRSFSNSQFQQSKYTTATIRFVNKTDSPFLDAHNIAYSHIWSMADYFDNKRQLTRLNDGTFQVDDKAWNKAKAEYCLENKIDFHIDDSAVYGKYFATPFCLYDAKNHTCANNQLIVDFRQSPVLALNSILNFVQQQKA